MTRSDVAKNAPDAKRMDRPCASTPGLNRPWDDAVANETRLKARRGARNAHRSHYSLYENMLK